MFIIFKSAHFNLNLYEVFSPRGGSSETTYLHVDQSAVLGRPGSLQDLKDGHGAAVHDVHLTLADGQPGQREIGHQQLLL